MRKSLNSAIVFSAIGLSFAGMSARCVAQHKSSDAKSTQQSGVSSRAPKLKLTRTQGSSQYDEVRCGLLDKSGNLWFGTTREGVYQYDGEAFTQYTILDGLNSNTVWSIIQDKSGIVWFGTDSGLSRWDGKNIRRIPFASSLALLLPRLPAPNQNTAEQPAVWSMHEDKKGTIWFGTSEGVLCYKSGVFSPFLVKADLIGVRTADVQDKHQPHLKMVDDILEDRQGNIWLASGMPPGMEGLFRFDGSSLTRFKPGGEEWIRTVIEDPDGVLWLGTRNKGVWRYDGKTFSQFLHQEELGMPMLVARSGDIWFSGVEDTNGLENKTGLWRYDGKKFQRLFTNEGMGKFGVWCAIEDRVGNIWVGTRNVGLYRYDGKSFTRFSE
jgi:ligand-binding sensor domain-containing protein